MQLLQLSGLTFLALLHSGFAYAQRLPAGIWEGKLSAGIDVRFAFTFSQTAENKTIVTIEAPDQPMKIQTALVESFGDSLKFTVADIGSAYKGRYTSDTTISGSWVQSQSLKLNLKKVDRISKTLRRQTPLPPFPYRSEDVAYVNKDGSGTLAGTITIPNGKGRFPAAILITGSGQQNRDEEISGHKPFAVIADGLTKAGMVVLRVDDRSIGGSTGDVSKSNSADFADDVRAGLKYLRGRREVDKKRIGMIGHSEGGMIAPMIAAGKKDIDFIVLLAAPGVKVTELMAEQNYAILSSSGMKKEAAEAYTRLYKNMVEIINASQSLTEAREKMLPAVSQWVDSTDKMTVLQTTGIMNEKTKANFATTFAGLIENPWLRYFLKFDPQPYLQKLSAKVLALNGSRDIQIISGTNLDGIRTALSESKSRSFEVKEIAGLNHLFQTCKTCTVKEYGELEESFSPEALELIRTWLKKNVIER